MIYVIMILAYWAFFIFLCGYFIKLLSSYERNRKHVIKLVGVVLLIGLMLKSCLYRTSYNLDPNELYSKNRNAWPSANGVVLDAETKKPIVGAQVDASANFDGFLGSGAGGKGDITKTDDQGRYKIPRLSYFGYVSAANYQLTVYKAGYVVYCSHWPFKGTIPQKFKFKDNVVLLEKWDDKKYTPQDHVDHVQYIGCSHLSPYSSEKGKAFCREAREEMILACIISEKYTQDHCTKLNDELFGRPENWGKSK